MLNRVERLNAILVHLQSKKRVTAAEIADRFQISLRSVYRDIKALEQSGVPIIGESGIGYTIMEGYRLPPVMFTTEEATALLLSGKLAERFTDPHIKEQFDNALYKIKAVLRNSDKEHIEELDNNVMVLNFGNPFSTTNNSHPYLLQLQQAIIKKRVVNITYYVPHSDSLTERDIEPIGLCNYAASWHCIAWCRLRKDYRDFRLTRINRLTVKDSDFINVKHTSLREYLDKVNRQKELEEVVVLFKKDISRFANEYKYYYGFVSEDILDDHIKMTFLTAYPELFARWLLTYTDCATIVSPASMVDKMKELTEALQSHYS